MIEEEYVNTDDDILADSISNKGGNANLMSFKMEEEEEEQEPRLQAWESN